MGDEPERWPAAGGRLVLVRHELLAPASAIVDYHGMLAEEARRLGRADLEPDIERIGAAAERLYELVAGLVQAGTTAGAEPASDRQPTDARLRHDLRTPLNAIVGYAALLREDLDEPETANLIEDLDQLEREATRVLEILERTAAAPPGLAEDRADASFERLAADVVRSMRPATARAPQSVGGRILVVDDNASNRDVLCRRLERDGHRAVAAGSAREALLLVEQEAFDIILLDLLMPEINGYELLMQLKAEPRTRGMPVLMVSGLNETESVMRCIEAGAEDYLEKPVNPVLLRARLGACLERKRAHDRERQYLADLAAEQARSEALLHNVLPVGIVARLKRGERRIADRFENVTILFCDLVNFTRFAAASPPGVVVGHLDHVFSGFDQLCRSWGVEKIKTIGDAYMAAAGLPEARDDHQASVAELALGMQDIVRDHNLETGVDFQIRIGVHSGPVVAGIIGRSKFIYDVWGDTVNVASRLEAHGLPGRIQVSPVFRAALADTYRFEERGTIELRGASRMPVHLLLGPI